MARAGQKIKLECEVEGEPHPELIWIHNDKVIPETRDVQFFHDGNKVGLTINEAFPKDAGVYRLLAKNLSGEASCSCTAAVKGIPPLETSDSELASDSELVKPVIKMPLKDATVVEGEKAQLDCIIVAQPEPEVIWYFEGKPVKESSDLQLIFAGDRCTLVIDHVSQEDSGEYEVVAINSAGEISSSCSLSVQSPEVKIIEEPQGPESTETIEVTETVLPKFNKLLDDILTREGDSVSLEVSISAQPAPTVRWYLNNAEIAPSSRVQISEDADGTHKLYITDVKPEDRGVYTVKAINSLGEVKCFSHLIVKENTTLDSKPSSDIQLEEKLSIPAFIEMFSDKTVPVEGSVKFECKVVGKPAPKIKWYFNNEPVSGSNFLVSTSGDRQILTIPEVRTEDQGKISCIAENEAGKTSCDAHLIVEDIGRRLELFPAPGQTMDTSSESYSYEMKRSLFSESSSIDGCAPTQQIQSFKSLSESGMKQSGSQPPLTMESLETEEYQNINGKESHHQSTKSSSNFGGILEKHESYQSNTNLPNALSFPKPIRKQTAPRFVSTLMGKIVDQGSNVALEGIIDGFPSPNISWSKNGVEVYPIPGKLTISWSLNKASLEISDVNLQDAGRYTCKAENDLGSATCTADIVVKKNVFSPIIGRRLQSQTVPTNERVILEVEVTGQPEPTVTWYKDNLEIPKSSGMFRFRSQGNSHALIIDKVSFSHGGQYTVKTKNEAGESSSSASVYVFEPPPSSAPNETVIETKLSGDWSAPSSTMQSTWQNSNSHPTQSISQFHEESKSSSALSESVFVSETVKRDKQVVIKLSNESQPLAQFTSPSKPIEPTPMFTTAVEHKPIEKPDFMTTSSNATEETTIEDQSITKRSALDFFKNIIKENETGSSQEKYESSTKSFSSFSEPVKETPKPSFSSSVPVLTSLPSPYVNKSYESFSESSSSFMKQTKTIEPFPQELKLEPGPPPEIGYIPKVTAPRPKPDMLSRVRKIEESQRELSPIEIPSGGVKIFPTISRKNSSELQQKFSERVEQKSVQASAYQKTPTYQNPPTYQSTLAYQNTSAYQSPPAYQSSSAFQSTAAYQSPPAYQSTPAYQSSPSHQSTSAYQTTPFSENVPPKSFKTEERKEVIEEAFVKKKVEFSGSQDATFLQQTQPAPFPNVDQKVKDHLPILRPQAENITLRPSSPRPSAEGISMEKLWSSKHKEESSTVLGEPIMRPASPIKRTPSPVKRTPSPVKRASSPYLSPTKVAPFSNLANASPQPFKSAAPAPSYFSPQPRAASPPPAFLSPQSQRVSSPIPSFVSSQMSASWYGSELKRAVSPRPSAEGVAMEKLWSRPHSAAPLKPTSPVFPKPLPYETKTPIQTKPLKKTWPPAKSPQEEVTAPWSNRVVEQSSTCEAIPGGYRAESKSFCSEQTKSVGKPAFSLRAKSVTPSFTSEKREMMSSYSSYSSSTTYNSSGSTNQTIQHTEPTPQSAFQPFHSQSPAVVEEKILKPSEAKKSWPPGKPSEPDYVPKKFTPKPVKMFQPPVTEVSLEALHLEPGPPPVLAYAEPPQNLRRQSYVEVIEEGLEKDIEKGPSKCLLGAVRTIPPPPSSKETAESQKENVHSSYQESRFSETHDQKVAPPWIAHTKRPLSVEIPPNQFSYSATSRQLRPVSCHMDSYAEMYSEQMYKSSSTQYSGALPNSLQPSSPPEYCNTFSSTTKVETKPKKSFQSDGYMADTDEPRHLLKQSNFSESNWQQRKYATLPASTKAYKKGATSFKPEERTVKLQDLNLEPFPFQPEPAKPARKQIVPPPASPSKFIKGDFRQSEYGTDYESVRIPPIWKPHDSDSEDISYRPVRPNLTPVSRRKKYENNVLPPLNFEDSPRSKFEPEKSTTPVKLKEILSPTKMQKSFPQSSPSNSYQTFASQPTYQNQSHQAQSTYQNQSHQVQSTYQNQSHQAQSTYQQMHQNHQTTRIKHKHFHKHSLDLIHY
ncbi:uncharacterized protein zormin isoform X1 [Bemisia tabaci]|uniref:uncharacterized protein zormin isoform X1 n=1 Tax=Bemisia tabaci TaxID=7038 RepID=UPI003B287168